jgi:hypothetical protein
LYAGATLRRWVRTFRHTQDRATLVGALRLGLVAGFRRGPRPNRLVLADVGLPDGLLAADRPHRRSA